MFLTNGQKSKLLKVVKWRELNETGVEIVFMGDDGSTGHLVIVKPGTVTTWDKRKFKTITKGTCIHPTDGPGEYYQLSQKPEIRAEQ
jgi:hypothetical protein